MEKIKTYFSILDEKLNNGFLKKTALLLYGIPGSGKSTFALHLVLNQCINENIALFISCDQHPSDIELMIESYWGKTYFELIKDNFYLLDGYSWRFKNNLGKSYLSLSNLSEFFTKLIENIEDIKNTCGKIPSLMVIDSISSIIDYNGIDSVSKFIQTLLAINNYEWEMIIILTMEEGAHTLIEVKKIEYIVDGIIHLHYDKKDFKRYLEIPHIKLSSPVQKIRFIVGENGIRFIR